MPRQPETLANDDNSSPRQRIAAAIALRASNGESGADVTRIEVELGPISPDLAHSVCGRVNALDVGGAPPGHLLIGSFKNLYRGGPEAATTATFLYREIPWNAVLTADGYREPRDSVGEPMYPAIDFGPLLDA